MQGFFVCSLQQIPVVAAVLHVQTTEFCQPRLRCNPQFGDTKLFSDSLESSSSFKSRAMPDDHVTQIERKAMVK